MGPLVSPRGNSAVAEYVDNEFEVIGKKGDYQAATNFLLSEKKFNFGNGQDRYEILEQALGECAGIVKDEQEAMGLLEAASKDWHVSETTGRLNATQWSIVYNCTDLTASVITGRQYDKPAHEFSLK